jgi:O-antigen/teichoic acid export membrane protein
MHADENPTITPSGVVEAIPSPPRSVTAISWTARFEPRLAWLFSWGTKGSLALTDQALFAGAQFVLNILLARWLDPAGYGAFAVAYSVYLLASGVHSALLVEPMMVFGSGRYLEKRRSYLGIVLRGHWLLTATAGFIMFGVGLLVARLNSRPVGYALCALGLTLPLMLLLWLTRRAFFIEMRPGRAAAGSAVYFCSLVVFVWWLRTGRMLTPASAILAMGAAASLAAFLQLVWLRSRWFHTSAELSANQIASEHWGYGRWVLASVFPSWTLLGLYYLVLPIWFGLGSSGALKALMNLAMPASHSLVAAGALVLPLLVRHRNRGGYRLLRQTVRRVTGFFVGGAVLYFLILWIFRIQIMSLLYGGKYSEYSGFPLLLIGLVPVVTACSVTFGAALSACERTNRIFWANVVASVFSVSLGLWFTATWGVPGAVAGYLASYAVLVVVFWLFYRALCSKSEAHANRG